MLANENIYGWIAAVSMLASDADAAVSVLASKADAAVSMLASGADAVVSMLASDADVNVFIPCFPSQNYIGRLGWRPLYCHPECCIRARLCLISKLHSFFFRVPPSEDFISSSIFYVDAFGFSPGVNNDGMFFVM
jgi:hypothetical protein